MHACKKNWKQSFNNTLIGSLKNLFQAAYGDKNLKQTSQNPYKTFKIRPFIQQVASRQPETSTFIGAFIIAQQEREARINGEITAKEVRLISGEGEQLGVVSLKEAMSMAEEQDVDLVEISPIAKPPVCKLMDFGKYKYEQSKKRDEAKKKQKQVQIKEIKFRPGTDDGDYNIKMRKVREFLADGDKVKITLRFRGREMAHQQIGAQLLERVKTDVAEEAQIESFPKLEGRQMVMMLAPKKK